MPKATNLTPKQVRFVAEYLVDCNATRAATRAGYSAANADKIGSQLLGKARVAQAIAARQAKLADKLEITQERVVRELAQLAFSSLDHFVIDDYGHVSLREGAPPDAMRAVSSIKRRVRTDEDGNESVETEIKLWDKPASIRMAGQHLGMFVEKHEHDVKLSLASIIARAAQKPGGGEQ